MVLAKATVPLLIAIPVGMDCKSSVPALLVVQLHRPLKDKNPHDSQPKKSPTVSHVNHNMKRYLQGKRVRRKQNYSMVSVLLGDFIQFFSY